LEITVSAQKIIIDTDPGQDEAVALLLALASPDEIEVRGVTAVAGIVPLSLTEKKMHVLFVNWQDSLMSAYTRVAIAL